MDARKLLLQNLKDKLKKGPLAKNSPADDDSESNIPNDEQSMKKVTIMSPSSEGLKEGVSKVQEILQKRKDLLDLGKHLANSSKMIGSENLVSDDESPDDRLQEAKEMHDHPEEEQAEDEASPELHSTMEQVEKHSPEELHQLKKHIDRVIARK